MTGQTRGMTGALLARLQHLEQDRAKYPMYYSGSTAGETQRMLGLDREIREIKDYLRLGH